MWDFYVRRPPWLQQGQKEEKRKKKVHNVSLINQQWLLCVKTKNEDVPTLLGKDRRLEAEAMREWFSFFTKSSIRNCSCSVSIWTSWARWQQTQITVWGCRSLTCWMYSTAMDVTIKSLFCQNWNMHIGVDLWCLIPNLVDSRTVPSPVFCWSAVCFVNATVSTAILTKSVKPWMWTGIHARNVH